VTDCPLSELPRRLAALPPAEVRALAEALGRDLAVEDIALPQSGLALLQLRDGALHDAYYLGEIPVARAQVRVRSGSGREAEGGALLLDDRAQLARSMAILDAVFRAGLPGWERVGALLDRGGAALRREERDRQAMAAATRVDFALLSTTHEEEDE
jgi:alpha-D-ribose 1-methylphosphonate 5-triphosphate synthase subunit PhnG